MLLRSSSTPILNSWVPPQPHHSNSKDFSPDHDNIHDLTLHQLPTTKSTPALTTSFPSPTHTNLNYSLPATHHTLDLRNPPVPRRQNTTTTPLEGLLSSEVSDWRREIMGLETVVDGSDGGGEMDGGDAGRGYGFYDYNNCGNDHGHEHDGGVEVYYQTMIEANPDNSLFLGNYARFLKEVREDLAKAEEYCARAIRASPGDANMLSLYANIIWETQRDARRARIYFNQAVKMAPHDCYVLASYAKFLWDVDEEEEDQDQIGEPTPSCPEHREGTPLTVRL